MGISLLRHCVGVIIFILVNMGGTRAWADARTKVAQETAEYLLQKFARQAVREGSQTLARKIEVYAARHGDDFIRAVKQVGPRTFHLVEEAGVNGGKAVQVLARHGEHGAWMLSRPTGMQMYLKHGDEVATVLIKHKGIEPVIERLGQPAIKALQAASPQSGRRLAMMLEGGDLAKLGRHEELLEVVAKWGDRGMTFVWNHKGALATTAGLSAFLSDPGAFITGAKDMAQIVGENAVRPVIQAPVAVATEVAKGTNWTIIFLFAGMAAFLFAGVAGLCFVAATYFGLGGWCKEKLQALQGEPHKPGAFLRSVGKHLLTLLKWFRKR